MEASLKRSITILILFAIALSTCSNPTITTVSEHATLVLTNGTLINGTGGEPVPDAVIVIIGERIVSAGPSSLVKIPKGVKVIDLGGAYVLPGFINAHVHDAYDESRLQAWAQAGVTTVRDEGILLSGNQLDTLIPLRDKLAASPKYARLISAGYMLTIQGGYGTAEITSAEDARQKVNLELDSGVDEIKLAIETGYVGVTGLPILSPDELSAIIATAHDRGKLVSAHVTQAKFLQMVVDAGVDDVAHIPADLVPKKLIQQMISQDTYLVPTLTVIEAFGGLTRAKYNLKRMLDAGVKIALGNDYTRVPQNNFDHFDLGMPLHEITRMSEAGMSPMQIIVASTRNAAHVCGLERDLGTLEMGKIADILIIGANPLQDLSALTLVKMVVHNGSIIRQ
jgi:imidazolonepropionase-like amidohydrolase